MIALVEVAAVLLLAGLIAFVGVRIGMLLAPWIERHGSGDDEETRAPD